MFLPPPLGLILLLVGLAFPMLEIAVLIKVGNSIGFWPTLAIVIGTAILGFRVLQQHGFMVVRRLSEAVNAGRTPFLPMIEGGVIFAAGLCLIAPGVITDTIGLVLLVPWVRHGVAKFLHDRVWRLPEADAEKGRDRGPAGQWEEPRPHAPQPHNGDGPIIEGEFERIDERPMNSNRNPPR